MCAGKTRNTNARARLLASTALFIAWVSGNCGTASGQPVPAVDTKDAKPITTAVRPAVSSGQLEQVTVTARRVRENLQKVPMAVTAFSNSAISALKIVSPEDLNGKVPSLSVEGSTNARDSSKYTIRGQGETFGGSEPAVITYFAEVPTISDSPGLLYDLQSVQILKGPQGTLFGRNTTGGAILVEPQRPVNRFTGFIDTTIGNYDARRVQGALNVPIVDDKLLARLAIDFNGRDGFTKDAITGREYDNRDYRAARFGLTWRPTEAIENYLMLNYVGSQTDDAGVELFSVNTNNATTPVPITLIYPGISQALATQKALGPRATEHDLQDGLNRIQSGGATNMTTINLNEDLLVKNILGYRDFRQQSVVEVDGTTLPILESGRSKYYGAGSITEPSTKSYSEEIQLQGKSFGHKLTWILGSYLEYQKPSSPNNQDLITQFAPSEAAIPQSTYIYQSLKQDRSKALFGQFTYDLSHFVPRLKFTGGFRYTWDWRSQISSNFPALLSCEAAAAGGRGYCRDRQTSPYSAPTGLMSLDYQLDQHTLIYVATRHGYKSGGFNVQAPTASQRVYGPEYVTDVEVGAKTDLHLGNEQLRLNGDLFRGMFSSLQENGVIFANGQELTVTQNAGNGVVQGIEIEGTWIPWRGIELSGFYAYTDAFYTSNDFGGASLLDLPFPSTPKNKFGLTARYSYELDGGAGTLLAGVSYTFQSRVYFQVPLVVKDTDPQAGQAGYGLLNLHADWDNLLGRPLDLTGYVSNLTNKVYKIFENDSYNIVGFSSGLYGEPRTFGFEARYHF